MRLPKVLVSVSTLAAVGLTVLTLATPSKASGDQDLLKVACTGGDVTVTAVAPWHTNPEGPWKWDKGTKVSVDKDGAKFKGAACTGTIKAFICQGTERCKGNIAVQVK